MISINGKEYRNVDEANEKLSLGGIVDVELSENVSGIRFPDLVIKTLKINQDLNIDNYPHFIGKFKKLKVSTLIIESSVINFIPKNIEASNFVMPYSKEYQKEVYLFDEADEHLHNKELYKKMNFSLVKKDKRISEVNGKSLAKKEDIESCEMLLEKLPNIPVNVLKDNKRFLKKFLNLYFFEGESFIITEELLSYFKDYKFEEAIFSNNYLISNMKELCLKRNKDKLSPLFMSKYISVKEVFEIYEEDFFDERMIEFVFNYDTNLLKTKFKKICLRTLENLNKNKNILDVSLMEELLSKDILNFHEIKGKEFYQSLFLNLNNNPLLSAKESLFEAKLRYIHFFFS